MKTAVIFGATSSIAQAVSQQLAERGMTLLLVGRNQEKLEQVQTDLQTRGAKQCQIMVQDLANITDYDTLISQVMNRLGRIDLTLIAHGTLPEQKEIEQNIHQTMNEIKLNGLSVIGILTVLANHLVFQRSGTIAVISSVAGDRGRQSNYVYGAAKAMVTTFLDGLRGRLLKNGIHVLTIKPGFVDTPMTADLPKGALWARPEKVAKDIVKAIDKKKNVLYTPFFWRFIMLIIKNIPEALFKKMKL